MQDNDKASLKAGAWYTISKFVVKGMAFLVTPIFTRLMTKGEYGDFSNLQFWLMILTYVAGFELYYSIMIARHDYRDEIDPYISSIYVLSIIITAGVLVLGVLFKSQFAALTGIETKYLPLVFLYLTGESAFMIMQTKHRAFYKYKLFTAFSIGSSFIATGLAVTLVALMPESRVEARFIGTILPMCILGTAIGIVMLRKGNTVKLEHWKYATNISAPLVVNVIALTLMSSANRTIIKNFDSSESTALYSLATSIMLIATLLYQSMNSAWAPWVQDCLHDKRERDVKTASRKFIIIYLFIIIGVLIVGPELILIMGGKAYGESAYILPPLMSGCLFQFMYSMFMNVELYNKKTGIAAIGAICMSAINIILGIMLVPRYGYKIAAYISMFGYIVLSFIHYMIVRKMNISEIYDIKFFFATAISTVSIIVVMPVLYRHIILRFVSLIVLLAIVAEFAYKNWSTIKLMIKK